MLCFDRENILRFWGWKVWFAKLNPREKHIFEHIFLTFLKTYEIFSSVADINLEKSFHPIHEFQQNSDAKRELCR